MAGLISLSQGAMGVAASVRRREPRPGAEDAGRIAQGEGASLDHTTANREPPTAPHDKKQRQTREPVAHVSPATLFEITRIATLPLSDDTASRQLAARRAATWTPPVSELALRDRSV